MNVHFIAIGGSAMHNLAIALSRKGYHVTGSDDEIREPSRSRLLKQGILPERTGWFPDAVHHELDAVIVGMHAREDNPELLRAKELGLRLFSYPEYLYEAAKDKIRVVIGGSHGKTSVTSMLLHATARLGLDVDYMVGAQLEGYDCMVRLSENARVMILEGDEYLSSPIDRRPKFHLYHPDIALLTGIAWDHINVFPTFGNYIHQFDVFASLIDPDGVLVWYRGDPNLEQIAKDTAARGVRTLPYDTLPHVIANGKTSILWDDMSYPLEIFGKHNLQNLYGAMLVAKELGIVETDFLAAMHDFTGAGKRLEKVAERPGFTFFKDFAHSPSKLKATVRAVREQFPGRKLIACMELHTFSSLNKAFLQEYRGGMNGADEALVYFNPKVVTHKQLEDLSENAVAEAFGGGVTVVSDTSSVLAFIDRFELENTVLLMMSSGNFDGIDFDAFGEKLAARLAPKE